MRKVFVIRHVILCTFKQTTSAKQRTELTEEFALMAHRMDEILQFEWGTTESAVEFDQTLAYCFTISFRNAKDRDFYLANDERIAMLHRMKPWLANMQVVEYCPNNGVRLINNRNQKRHADIAVKISKQPSSTTATGRFYHME